MLKPLTPPEQEREGFERKHGADDTGESKGRFFRFRPIAFYHYAAEEARKCQTEKEKRERATDVVRQLFWRSIVSRWLWLLLFIATVGGAFGFLYGLEYLDSNRTIALFTAILTVIAGTEMWAVYRQWQVMRDQSAQMVKQGQQTDKMIEVQQRAWIAASILGCVENFNCYVNELATEDLPTHQPDIRLTIRNEGETPAVIIHSYVGMELTKPALDVIEALARSQRPTRTCAAPDDILIFYAKDSGQVDRLPKLVCDDIREGRRCAYIVGAFIYRDIFEIERKTVCSFKYSDATVGFSAHMEDGAMT